MNLTLALAQVQSESDSRQNLTTAAAYVARAQRAGASLVVFPEVFMNHYPSGTPIEQMETESLEGPFVGAMRDLAHQYGMWCVFGMRETAADGSPRAFNTTVVVRDTGEVAGVYRKTHLYDAFGARESDRVQPGDTLFEPIASPWGCLGVFVCYELRFPEIAREQVARGADILIVPSGWVRGPMKEYHWEHLIVTRALENTVFLAACDQVSDYYCGRSVVVDPMGVQVVVGGEVPQLLVTTIDTARIAEVRAKLPSLQHRRPALYRAMSAGS